MQCKQVMRDMPTALYGFHSAHSVHLCGFVSPRHIGVILSMYIRMPRYSYVYCFKTYRYTFKSMYIATFISIVSIWLDVCTYVHNVTYLHINTYVCMHIYDMSRTV